MKYAVMQDFKLKEIYVAAYTEKEYAAASPFDDKLLPASVFDNAKEALREARRVAKISRWTYNATRNSIERSK